jgi:hypothetical protein
MSKIIKNPIGLSAEELSNLKSKAIKIHIGDSHSNDIKETLEGNIFEVGVSPAEDNLPTDIKFEDRTGKYKSFTIFEIKIIEVL